MSARSRPPTDELKTEIYDSSAGRRPKSATQKGQPEPVPPAVPQARQRVESEPLRVISMKAPAEDTGKQAVKQHQVRLRSLAEIHPRRDTPPSGLGFLAPPRDPREVRARRVRDYFVWGSIVVIVGCAVMIGVWLLARR
jgi:hypothetical protein